MSVWTALAALGFGGLLTVTVLIQPVRWGWRKRMKHYDPLFYVPIWTFFAPEPLVHDFRLIWRERLTDGTIGPWHEIEPPQDGLLRGLWNPKMRARKAVFDFGFGLVRHATGSDRRSAMLSLEYLGILQHVLGLASSPLSAGRQFAVVRTKGADSDDGALELQFASTWHLVRRAAV